MFKNSKKLYSIWHLGKLQIQLKAYMYYICLKHIDFNQFSSVYFFEIWIIVLNVYQKYKNSIESYIILAFRTKTAFGIKFRM